VEYLGLAVLGFVLLFGAWLLVRQVRRAQASDDRKYYRPERFE
jgi:ABC-type nickel/cobalt efflux system permease component RcnA